VQNISKEDVSLERDAQRLLALVIDIARRHCLRDPLAGQLELQSLTPSQLHALMWLGFDGPLTMGELARRLGITEKTITGIVDRLERSGLLGRERDKRDRRVVHARLTRRGETAHAQHQHLVSGKIHRFLALLDATDRRALFRLLGKLSQGAPPGAVQAKSRLKDPP
jgi:DNA-binding MarR family transcriptional regulator